MFQGQISNLKKARPGLRSLVLPNINKSLNLGKARQKKAAIQVRRHRTQPTHPRRVSTRGHSGTMPVPILMLR